jgi:hypothetical protein
MPASTPDPKINPSPRATAADSFEQNPLGSVNVPLGERFLTAEELDQIPEEERVREAVRRVIQEGVPVTNVARELHLTASSIRNWKSRYASFLAEKTFGESNPAVAAEDALIQDAAQAKFADNWGRLMDRTHAVRDDFKQDPLEVFLQTNSGTSWLFDQEGKVERFTVFGVIVALLGITAVFVFLMTDKGEITPSQDYLVRELPVVEPKYRFDLDVERGAQVVQKFLRADGYLSKLSHLREQEKVMPIVKEYYSRHDAGPITDAIHTYGMTGHGLISLAFDIPSKKTSWFFNLTPYQDSYQIDWMTSTLYQTEHIEKFLLEKPSTPTTLHIMLTRGTYYNYQWSDEGKYQCYNLTFPGLPREIYGYTVLDSELGIDLNLLTAMSPSHAAVLEVRFPENAKDPRQVEILKLVSKDWLPF